MGIVAPFNVSELNRTPYVSVAEVKGSAIAASLDFDSLIPNGGGVTNLRALRELITSASVVADNFVFGPLGTMGASLTTGENFETRPDRLGLFRISPRYKPVLELRSFTFGPALGAVQSVTLTNQNARVFLQYFTVITGWAPGNITIGSLSDVLGQGATYDSLCYCEYDYVNGFGNTFLSAPAHAGDETLSIETATGFYPLAPYTIWDSVNNEEIQVDSSYDGTSLSLPLASPLLYDHVLGTNLSAIPKTVKDAVIHLVCASVRQRGAGGLVLSEIGSGSVKAPTSSDTDDDRALAYDLLDDFKVLMGQR